MPPQKTRTKLLTSKQMSGPTKKGIVALTKAGNEVHSAELKLKLTQVKLNSEIVKLGTATKKATKKKKKAAKK